MVERLELARPMMRRRAGFDPHQARWQLLEACQDVPPLQLSADGHLPLRINAVHLENRLRDVETDCLPAEIHRFSLTNTERDLLYAAFG